MTAFTRRYRIDSADKWQRVLRLLFNTKLDFDRTAIIVHIYEEHAEKSDAQRAMFHATLQDLATKMGLSPREMKELIKHEYFGVEVKTVAGRQYEFVRSSEELDRKQYSELIDFTLRWAAENGIYIPDRRTQ